MPFEDQASYSAEMRRRRSRATAILLVVGLPAIALAIDSKTHFLGIPDAVARLIGLGCLAGAILHAQLYRCASCGARLWNLRQDGCPGCGRSFGIEKGRWSGEEREALSDSDREIFAGMLRKQMAPLVSLARYEQSINRKILPVSGALGLGLAALLWARDHSMGAAPLLIMAALPPLLCWFFLGYFVVGIIRPFLWRQRARCPRCHTSFGAQVTLLGPKLGFEYEVPKFCAHCGLPLRGEG
jgi:hypothetical protein